MTDGPLGTDGGRPSISPAEGATVTVAVDVEPEAWERAVEQAAAAREHGDDPDATPERVLLDELGLRLAWYVDGEDVTDAATGCIRP